MEEDDLELEDDDAVNIISDDDNSESDPMESFPLANRDITLVQTVGRISNILQYGKILSLLNTFLGSVR